MVSIRKIDSESAKEMKSILAQLYYQNAVDCSHMEGFSMSDAENKIESLIVHLEDDTALCYGVFCEDIFAGYVWAYVHTFRDEKRMYISEIRVLEQYRSRGFGRKLLNAVENYAKGKNLPALYLHAEANNIKAISLYESENYTIERVQMRKGLA